WNRLDNVQETLCDSREDHQTALQQVSGQMEQPAQALQSQIEHQAQTEALIKEHTTPLETCHQEQGQQYQAQETQRQARDDSQEEQTARSSTAAGEIQKAVWQLQQNNSEGQSILLKALDRLDRNGIQKLLVSMEDQAENQSDLIDEVKA